MYSPSAEACVPLPSVSEKTTCEFLDKQPQICDLLWPHVLLWGRNEISSKQKQKGGSLFLFYMMLNTRLGRKSEQHVGSQKGIDSPEWGWSRCMW